MNTVGDVTLSSMFEFDEHRHIYTDENGVPVVRLKFNNLSDERNSAVTCFATVWYVFGAEGEVAPIMEYQRISLTNKTSATGWKGVISVIQSIDPREWEPLIQLAISASMREWFEGATAHALIEDIDVDKVESPFLIEPLVSSSGMTHHYSPPNTGKSMLAMGIAVSVATGHPIFGATPNSTGPVVYLDFEDVKRTHDIRTKAILKGIKWTGEWPEIHHYKVTGKLTDHVSRIRGLARETGAVLVILDSLGKARGADPSDGDATIKITNAIEAFALPVLAIDHVTKSVSEMVAAGKLDSPEAIYGIGSQFSHSAARLGWFFQKMTSSKPNRVVFNIHNNKHNLVPKQDSRSVTMELESNERSVLTRIKFKTWDNVAFEEMRVEGGHVTIARWMVREGKLSVTGTEAAKGTGLSTSAAARALTDHEDWFEKMSKVKQSQPFKLTDAGREQLGITKVGETDET
jgi:hypothetical protein